MEKVLGRPAAPLIISDGSLLISDDKANVIYRITYKHNLYNKIMRVGIAGYGVVGKTRHRSIESNTSYQVTAISESSEKLENLFQKA